MRIFSPSLLAILTALVAAAPGGDALDTGPAGTVNAPSRVEIRASRMFEGFETYGGDLPLLDWPAVGAFNINPYGKAEMGLFPRLATDLVREGRYSLYCGYNLTSEGWASMGYVWHPNLDWSRWDGVRFWLVPDGTGRTFRLGYLDWPPGRDAKEFYLMPYYTMKDRQPVVITVPFAAFTNDKGGPNRNDQVGIEETAFFIEQTEDGQQVTDMAGKTGPGFFYIDSIELVTFREPLEGMLVEPVGQPLPPRRIPVPARMTPTR
jgi:hypothetical protein